MVQRVLFLFLLFSGVSAGIHAQINAQGAQIIFGSVSTVGREIKRTTDENKARKEQEEAEALYNEQVLAADQLFNQNKFAEAKAQYNQALTVKREQYVVDQIARCDAEIARANRSQYQILVDKGDSLMAEMKYDSAIETYNAALAVSNQKYATDRLAEAKAYQEMWKKVMFSGLLIADARVDEYSSKAFNKDPFSDYMKPGKYPIIDNALIYSNYKTLDGIAVPANMHLVIYSQPNFKGTVLLDIVGPAIINNISKNTSSETQELKNKTFAGPIESVFPASTRSWSSSDMNQWISGSMIIE